MKKILLITLGVIAVIIIGLTVFIKIYVTPQRVKEFVIPAAERSLNRKIDIGEINISLLQGIGIKDFYIKETDGETDFVRCEEFVLKFRLLPLLSKRVVIDEIKLVSPGIRIERDKDGKYNFEDIGQKKETEKPEEKKADDSGALPISLVVSSASISNAKLSVTDHKGGLPDIKSSADIDIRVESISGGELSARGSIDLTLDEAVIDKKTKKRIKDITAGLRYAFKINTESDSIVIEKADLSLQKIPVSVIGEVTKFRTSPELDILISVPKTKVSEILETATLFTDIKGLSMSGDVEANVKLKGPVEKIETLKAETSVKLEKSAVSYDTFSSVIDADMEAVLRTDSMNIVRADLKVDSISASIKGDVTKLDTDPYLDIAVTVPETGAADIVKTVSSFVNMKEVKLSGRVSADMRLKGAAGSPASLKTDGQVLLKTVGIKYMDADAVLDGRLKFKDKTAGIDINGTYGRNSATVKGSIENYMGNQNINLNVYSKALYIDELEPVLLLNKSKKSGTPSGKKGTPEQNTVREAEPFNLKLSAAGEVKVDTAYYRDLVLNDFLMKYSFKNNKLNLIESGKAGKGSYNISTLMDLSRPGYTYSMSGNVDSFHIEEIVNTFFPKAKDTVFGRLTSNFKLNGAGTLPENMKRNLAADVDFIVKDGMISNAELARQLSLFINVRELETIKFTTAEGTVKIRDGVARLNTSFISKDLAMDPKGDIGLDETLALAFDLKLSPRLTDKAMSSKISQYMKSEEGWGMIPLKVYGTFSDPSYTVDIEKAGKRVIKKETDKLIDKLFDKQDEKKNKELEPLKDLLKGILQ